MKPAHVHLLSALAAELSGRGLAPGRPLRLLDVGCGYGQLIVDLMAALPAFGVPLSGVEIYGFEVLDHRAGTPRYMEEALKILSARAADRNWSELIRIGQAGEAWPFPDGFFDAAFSNQVIEHVEDLGHFFHEQGRVVKTGGVAVHFYPSRESIFEPHSGVPFAHWVRRPSLLSWLRLGSQLGFGKFRRYRKERGSSLDSFCHEFHQYLGRYVFFRRNAVVRDGATRFSSESGFGYSVPLAKRAFADDWEPGAYRFDRDLGREAWIAPLACSTLVQRF